MNTSPAEQTLATHLATLAAVWVLRQAAPGTTLENAGTVLAAWRKKTPVEQALLPEAARMLNAATQELMDMLASTPQGAQALRDIGLAQCAKNNEPGWAA